MPHIGSFADFWPYYIRQHSKPRTRLLHATGSVLSLAVVALALTLNVWLFVAAPVVGYAFAWYAHFFVERNKPATFGHPFYSLLADYRMVFLMMAGRMDAEVAKATREASGPVSPAGSPAASAPVRSADLSQH